MNEFIFNAENESDTQRLGAALAAALPDRATVALSGTLGAGKTRLTKAIAEACGIAGQDVVSPTFVLCQHYQGDRTIYHLDAYRIADEDEFLQLGPEEYFESAGITIIEWAERVSSCLPNQRIDVQIDATGEFSRTFRVTARGRGLGKVIPQLELRLGQSNSV